MNNTNAGLVGGQMASKRTAEIEALVDTLSGQANFELSGITDRLRNLKIRISGSYPTPIPLGKEECATTRSTDLASRMNGVVADARKSIDVINALLSDIENYI